MGRAGSVECGALVQVELTLRESIVTDVDYRAYGCPATLACAAAVIELAKDRRILEAARIGSGDLISGLHEAAANPASADLAVDALHAALGMAVSELRGSDVSAPSSLKSDPLGVLVGMSGGVDSSAAGLLLQRRGYHPVGVTLSLWSDEHSSGERSCCSPETVRRARRVAQGMGLPHLTIDAGAAFSDLVVDYFVREYERGWTPNPCCKCNARVRFGLLLEIARRLGLTWVATGHYARLMGPERSLARGQDKTKDQSYVLAEVDPSLLRHVLFPLGEMSKGEVRGMAADAALEGHDAPESQEICFIPDDDHRRFLRERLGERPGAIVDLDGHHVGSHRGTYNFTIGQRKGLRIAAGAPLYVVDVDTVGGNVIVGSERDLEVDSVTIGSLVWHRPVPTDGIVQLQVRSSGAPLPGRLVARPGDRGTREGWVVVTLDRPGRAVACGQTGVVYEGENVVCAGTIIETGRTVDGAI